MRVAVIALQGGVAPHLAALRRLGHDAFPARTPGELARAEGLVLPGGESTAQRRLLASAGLVEPVRAAVARGAPLLATCAGLVLCAARVQNDGEAADAPRGGWGFLDVTVARNGWGRQVDSFEARDDRGEIPLVMIRAPRITAVGSGVEVLATFRGEPVLVRQGRVLAATFHPELTDDERVAVAAFGRAAERRAGAACADEARRFCPA